ncbi:MAG: aminopeptidase [Elusimicrobiota bacterium]|nr:aminopeptidase [Elusimicrobiota bacterium]
MGRALGLLFLTALAGCSPLYAYRSAAGHAGLLWRSRSIEKSIADPSTAPGRRERLKLVVDARRFAVERLALAPSRDYQDWTPVDGAVTWLVYACSTDSLKPVSFLGFPYKGHFRRAWAEREAASWAKKGYDAAVMPAGAYNTPFPIADPLPSSALTYGPGDLAELLFHEFTHGTVDTRDQAFNEAMASWIGERGVKLYLVERFGEASPELDDWEFGRARSETMSVLFEELGKLLDEHYKAGRPDREKLFDWARAEAAKTGLDLPKTLNNAVVAAHRTYRGEPALFDALHSKHGSDWRRTLAALGALDRKDPWPALRAATR